MEENWDFSLFCSVSHKVKKRKLFNIPSWNQFRGICLISSLDTNIILESNALEMFFKFYNDAIYYYATQRHLLTHSATTPRRCCWACFYCKNSKSYSVAMFKGVTKKSSAQLQWSQARMWWKFHRLNRFLLIIMQWGKYKKRAFVWWFHNHFSLVFFYNFSRFLVLFLLLLGEGLCLLLMDSEYNYAAKNDLGKGVLQQGKPNSSLKKQLLYLKCPVWNIVEHFVK